MFFQLYHSLFQFKANFINLKKKLNNSTQSKKWNILWFQTNWIINTVLFCWQNLYPDKRLPIFKTGHVRPFGPYVDMFMLEIRNPISNLPPLPPRRYGPFGYGMLRLLIDGTLPPIASSCYNTQIYKYYMKNKQANPVLSIHEWGFVFENSHLNYWVIWLRDSYCYLWIF